MPEDHSLDVVDLDRQYESIRDEIERAALAVLASSQYILGEELEAFEEDFAGFCGVGHCVGVGSGTAAIQLALEALGVSRGDEVILPANTFFGTALAVLRAGATPVLVDCDDETATIAVDQVADAIGPRTRAVLAVHLYGHPADVDPLLDLCRDHDLALVEDACQAHGARYKGRRVGGLGAVAAFSFYPSKNLGGYGDGGAVTTDDSDLADRIRVLRNVGQASRYLHVAVASNERLDTLQAALLRVKLRYLEVWNETRRGHAAQYDVALAGTRIGRPSTASWAEHVWHLYVVRTPSRDDLSRALQAAGIRTGMHYPLPVHLQPALADQGYGLGDFPVSEAWAKECLSLPMFPELGADEIERVATEIRHWVPDSRELEPS